VSTEPRSGHELIVFVVPDHLGVPAAAGVDGVVARTRGVNTEYAWLVVNTRVRAVRPPAAEVTGALLAGHCAAPNQGTADLAEGLAMAAGMAHQFLADHDDGLPVAVDLLVVADPRCRLDDPAAGHLPSGGVVQAGVVLHDYTLAAVLPMGMRRLYTDSLTDLGLLWMLLRARHRTFRRPATMLG
jgi:hypothetical protein